MRCGEERPSTHWFVRGNRHEPADLDYRLSCASSKRCESGTLHGQSPWRMMDGVVLIALDPSGPKLLPVWKPKCSSWSPNNGQTGIPGIHFLSNAGSSRGESFINLALCSPCWVGAKVSLRGWSLSALYLGFLAKRTGFTKNDTCRKNGTYRSLPFGTEKRSSSVASKSGAVFHVF